MALRRSRTGSGSQRTGRAASSGSLSSGQSPPKGNVVKIVFHSTPRPPVTPPGPGPIDDPRSFFERMVGLFGDAREHLENGRTKESKDVIRTINHILRKHRWIARDSRGVRREMLKDLKRDRQALRTVQTFAHEFGPLLRAVRASYLDWVRRKRTSKNQQQTQSKKVEGDITKLRRLAKDVTGKLGAIAGHRHRELRWEEREHNHILQLVALLSKDFSRMQTREGGASSGFYRFEKLTEHDKRTHLHLLGQFSKELKRLRSLEGEFDGLHDLIQSEYMNVEKVLNVMSHSITRGKAPTDGQVGTMLNALQRHGTDFDTAVKHAVGPIQALAGAHQEFLAFHRRVRKLQRREIRYDRQAKKWVKN